MSKIVTIPLEEYESMVKIVKLYNSKKSFITIDIVRYAFGVFEESNILCDEDFKKILEAYEQKTDNLKSEIYSLKAEIRDLKIKKENKKWYQF